MNRISVAIATAMLLSVGLWAQNTNQSTQSTTTTQSTTQSTTTPTTSGETGAHSAAAATSAGEMTVNGCLSGSAGTFVLTEGKSGRSFTLEGDNAELSKQVGHEVAVTGTPLNPNQNRGAEASSSSSEVSGSNTSPDTRAHHVQVSSVRELADHCSNNDTTTK